MENNFNLNGDEARLLMNAMLNSNVGFPTGPAIQLYMKLNNISNLQPQKLEEKSNE